MCLGGGGGYTPPPMKQAPAPQPGPASPNDMVNNQQIANANDRSSMEGNRNAMDPSGSSPKPASEAPKKDQLKLESGQRHDSMIALNPAYREAYQRGDLSGPAGGINN